MDNNLRESVSVKGQRRKVIDKMIKTKNGIELSPRGSKPLTACRVLLLD